MMGKTTVNVEREAILESRKERHYADVTEICARYQDHANLDGRVAAGYLMGIVSAMTNAQASRAALEAIATFGLAHGRVDDKAFSKAVAIACADGDV
jgi:hypothetical protein